MLLLQNMRKKILFVYTNYSSFVKTDFEILSSEHDVIKYQFKPAKGLVKTGIEFLKQFFYLLFNIWKFDSVFIWFADYHSFLPVLFTRLLNKKSFVVIGGFDAVALPELKYGLFQANIVRQILGKIAIKYSSFLLPVDKSLIKSNNKYASDSLIGIPVGLKNYVRNIKGKIIPIPTGYNSDVWREQTNIKRNNSIVTVGFIPDWLRWKLKGCDLIYELANNLKRFDFYIYGISKEFLAELKIKIAIPPNLFLFNKISANILPEIYSKHKIYAQFSLSEGLPNVLCESILCGCIPVGSNVNGIPTAILDQRLILSHKNLDLAIEIINTAMNLPKEKNTENYNYIARVFTIENRKNAILDLL